MTQGQTLIAKSDFGFRASPKGRAVQVRKGQRFWVTSSQTYAARVGFLTIDREGKGSICNGYAFAPTQVAELFEVA